MDDKGMFWRSFEPTQPLHDFIGVGVCGQCLHRYHLGADRYVLAVDTYRRHSRNNLRATGATGLEARH